MFYLECHHQYTTQYTKKNENYSSTQLLNKSLSPSYQRTLPVGICPLGSMAAVAHEHLLPHWALYVVFNNQEHDTIEIQSFTLEEKKYR